MIRSLELKELGRRIEATDLLLLTLVAHRMQLSLNVGAYKKARGEQIYRRAAELKRLDIARFIAVNIG
ncbi:chorismate mutase, partial [Patescibacteria group bacterium]|nr:chorismate mutase [Patescibacteria group bacterium]